MPAGRSKPIAGYPYINVRKDARFSGIFWIADCIPICYAKCMSSEQIAVRLPRELLARLDDLVRSGVYESRAEAVRAGIESIADMERRRAVDRSIVDGYRRRPPTRLEEAAALASLREAIEEEPW
jgi:Arc/MetJ-type ribon-helix-helix transcriptional regulator